MTTYHDTMLYYPVIFEDGPSYEDAANAVAGSYIVTLKVDKTKSGSAEGRAVAEKYGADIERTHTRALNGYAVDTWNRPVGGSSGRGGPGPTRAGWAGCR